MSQFYFLRIFAFNSFDYCFHCFSDHKYNIAQGRVEAEGSCTFIEEMRATCWFLDNGYEAIFSGTERHAGDKSEEQAAEILSDQFVVNVKNEQNEDNSDQCIRGIETILESTLISLFLFRREIRFGSSR